MRNIIGIACCLSHPGLPSFINSAQDIGVCGLVYKALHLHFFWKTIFCLSGSDIVFFASSCYRDVISVDRWFFMAQPQFITLIKDIKNKNFLFEKFVSWFSPNYGCFQTGVFFFWGGGTSTQCCVAAVLLQGFPHLRYTLSQTCCILIFLERMLSKHVTALAARKGVPFPALQRSHPH